MLTMVRKLNPTEFEKIRPLMDAFKASVGEDELTGEEYFSLKKAFFKGDIEFIVIDEDGAIIGMCTISRFFSTYRCACGAVFDDFYILPEHRKKGLAKKMLDFVLEYCDSNYIQSLQVGCADVDKEMYEHLGFNIPLGNLLTWHARRRRR